MSKTNKPIKPLNEQQLRKLNTRNLLSYLKRLNKCYDGPNWDDYDTRTKYIYKKSEKWVNLHKLVKTILSEREHYE